MPTSYRVSSHNFTHAHGANVNDDQLAGLNVPALIFGGHLTAVAPPVTTPTNPGDGAPSEE